MKMIVAIVRPHAVDTVRETLQAHGVQGMTVSEVKGFGRQQGHTEVYRGAEYQIDFVPKARIETVVESDAAEAIMAAIAEATRTGKIGDGKVFALPVESAIRVRTGERDTEAL